MILPDQSYASRESLFSLKKLWPLTAVLALMGAAPNVPFLEPPKVEVWASEQWPAEALATASRLPGATLALSTRSNMLTPDVFSVLARRESVAVQIKPDLLPVHIDQLAKLAGATFIVSMASSPTPAQKTQLNKLGPQSLRFVVQRMDQQSASWLADFKNVEVELDLRGRIPEQEELGYFAGLSRARRVVRIRDTDPVALIAGLKAVRPMRIVIESATGQIPETILSAIVEAGYLARISIDTSATAADLVKLSIIPQISFELHLKQEPEASLAKASLLLQNLTKQH